MEVNIMKNGVFNWLSHRKMVQRGKRVWTLKKEIRNIKEFFLGGGGEAK